MKKLLFFFLFTCISALGQDGTPDFSFSGDGIVSVLLGEAPPPLGSGYFLGIDETPNGDYLAFARFVYLGSHNYLISILEDGTLDPNWGIDGFLELEEISDPYHNGISIQNDGKILLKNQDANINGLYRYLTDGNLDNSFASNGYLEFVNPNNNFQTVVLNDYIYYLSTINTGIDFTLIIEKYTPDGQFDNSFGNNGILEMPFGSMNSRAIKDWFVLPNNEIMVAFEETDGSLYSYHLAKFNFQGSLITAYGNNGITSAIPVDPIFNYNSILMVEDGTCYMNFMYFDANEESYKTFFKLDHNGQIDSNFANQGEKEGLIARLVQENGRIIADNPYYDFEGGYTMGYQRLYSNGALDTTFTFDPPSNIGLGYTVSKILDSGKLLIASGPIWYDPEPYLSVQRLHNSPLGFKDLQKQKVTIGPNPSTGIFHIDIENFDQNLKYLIYDITGKRVQTGTIASQNTTLDLASFEAGMYFLHLGDTTYKLIKN